MSDPRTRRVGPTRDSDASADAREAPMAGKVTAMQGAPVQDSVAVDDAGHGQGSAATSAARAGAWFMNDGLRAAMGLPRRDGDPAGTVGEVGAAPNWRPGAPEADVPEPSASEGNPALGGFDSNGMRVIWRGRRRPAVSAANATATTATTAPTATTPAAKPGAGDAMWRHLVGEDSTAVGTLARVRAPKGVRLRTSAAPAALGLAKRYVKVAAGGVVKDSQTTVIDGKAVTIVADVGAKLDRDGDGSIVEIRNTGAEVTIYDLEITGASGDAGANNGIAIAPGGTPKLSLVRVVLSGNQGNGISATGGTVSVAQSTVSGNAGGGISASGGMLAVTQSTVSGNQGGGISASGGMLTVAQSTVSGNQGGGISAMNATFDITNNFIFRNGNSTTATVDGASLAPNASGASSFAFNTIVDNLIQNSAALSGGVFCDTAGFMAANNIIVRNFVNNDAGRANERHLCLSKLNDSHHHRWPGLRVAGQQSIRLPSRGR